jgi:co-chaperonin GroES (HSP10)
MAGKNPGGIPEGPSLSDLRAEAQQMQAMREIEKAPQYSDEAPFVATPDNGWYLCRRIHVTQTPAGIVLPDTAQFSHFQVVAFGQGEVTAEGYRVPMVYKPGDTLLVHGGAVAQIHEGVSLFFVMQRWILCKVEPKVATGN